MRSLFVMFSIKMRAVQLLPVFAILASAAPQARPQGLAEALAREGVNSSGHPGQVHVAAAIAGNQISQNGWTAFAYSVQAGNEASLAIDGNSNTFWHSEYSPTNAALPHSFTIDMKQQYNIAGLSYLPRQDGNKHGNIGQHQISVSVDGNNFGSPVAFGTFLDDQTQKNVSFEPVPARYVRINALSEAGNRGPWSSAAEFNIYSAYSYNPPGNNIGKWGPNNQLSNRSRTSCAGTQHWTSSHLVILLGKHVHRWKWRRYSHCNL